MKSYTDIEQSKKLTEILPLESADMCLNTYGRKNMPPLMIPYSRFDEFFNMGPTPDFLIPCWSLTALLELLPYPVLSRSDVNNFCCKTFKGSIVISSSGKNPIDACVEMIYKLKENNLL